MCNKSPNNYDLGLKTSAIITRESKHVLNESLKWFCYRWFLLVEENYRIINDETKHFHIHSCSLTF